MPATLGSLLAGRDVHLLGREAELRSLLALVHDQEPLVAIVHGVAGIGKSALLRAFAARASSQGALMVSLDGRSVEPTPHGFTAAVASSVGAEPKALHATLAAEQRRVVIAIDTAEQLRLLESWLRLDFIPSLPDTVRVVLGTRHAPGAAWRGPFGELLSSVALGPLAPPDAWKVLREAGLDDEQAAWVDGFARGHPLSLRLAASAVRERPTAGADAVMPTVVAELAAIYVDGLDPQTRMVLDAASVLRRVTRSVLAAVLQDGPADGAFECLAALPFVDLGPEGLVLHQTVRDVLARRLRAADPVRHRAWRAAAWRQIRRELGESAGAQRWASLADMIHLIEEPLVREAFFPAGVQHYAIEPAQPSDLGQIEAIVARHEPPQEVELCAAWFRQARHAFRVARGPRGNVVAFTILCEPRDVPSRLLSADPLCRGWRSHLRSHPVAPGERILFARMALAYATGSGSSPCLAALLRDIERACLEAGPALRRIYSAHRGSGIPAQVVSLGFGAAPGVSDIAVGGARYGTLVCDLGPESAAGWLSGLAARDLPVGGPVLDDSARELRLDGARVPLTQLEGSVLRYLRERENQPVSRDALLRDVWGYEWTGGSNVVEVAISGLRRKLGDRAAALETVRGVGYRLRPLDGAVDPVFRPQS